MHILVVSGSFVHDHLYASWLAFKLHPECKMSQHGLMLAESITTYLRAMRRDLKFSIHIKDFEC